ncbi:hypothetical protein ACOMHN_062416 [Nucella lapillus]
MVTRISTPPPPSLNCRLPDDSGKKTLRSKEIFPSFQSGQGSIKQDKTPLWRDWWSNPKGGAGQHVTRGANQSQGRVEIDPPPAPRHMSTLAVAPNFPGTSLATSGPAGLHVQIGPAQHGASCVPGSGLGN